MWSYFYPKKPEPSTETELPYLPDDMWALILCELHPIFILDVMRVSQRFNKVVRETVFQQIMWDYLPPGTPPVPTERKAPDKHYKHFILHYRPVELSSRHATPAARGLFTDIEAGKGSWDRISTLDLSAFDLYSRTKDGVDLLTYVNNQDSQELRDIVFSRLCKYQQHQPSVIERVKNVFFKSTEQEFELYQMAAGLNQERFLGDYTPDRRLEHGPWRRAPYPFLNLTILYNHVESAILLLKKYKWQQWNENRYKSLLQVFTLTEHPLCTQVTFDEPLTVCAKYNRYNIYPHLIQYCDNTISPQAFYRALWYAVAYKNIEMITLLVADVPDVRNMLKGEFGIALFHAAIKTNNVEIVRILLTAGAIPSDEAKKVAEERNVKPEILVLLNNPETPKPRGP